VRIRSTADDGHEWGSSSYTVYVVNRSDWTIIAYRTEGAGGIGDWSAPPAPIGTNCPDSCEQCGQNGNYGELLTVFLPAEPFKLYLRAERAGQRIESRKPYLIQPAAQDDGRPIHGETICPDFPP